jgi:hypothetical protein
VQGETCRRSDQSVPVAGQASGINQRDFGLASVGKGCQAVPTGLNQFPARTEIDADFNVTENKLFHANKVENELGEFMRFPRQ